MAEEQRQINQDQKQEEVRKRKNRSQDNMIYSLELLKNMDFFDNLERETRLELATPTLARLCSTN